MEVWSPQLPTGFLVPRGTHAPAPRDLPQSAYGTLTLSGRPFQQRSAPRTRRAAALPLGPGRPSNPVAASGRQPSGRRRFGLLPFRSPLLRESLSAPRGTEMFHFPRSPPSQSYQAQAQHFPRGRRGSPPRQVAPFGYPRISARPQLPGAFRRSAASFLGPGRRGIHRAPLTPVRSFGFRSGTPTQSNGPRQGRLTLRSFGKVRIRDAAHLDNRGVVRAWPPSLSEWDDSGYGDQRASALRGTAPPPQARPLLPRPVPSAALRAPLG